MKYINMSAGAVLYADYVVVRWIVLQTMVGLDRFQKLQMKVKIPSFQGDSLWGSLHVLLFNTVSEYTCFKKIKHTERLFLLCALLHESFNLEFSLLWTLLIRIIVKKVIFLLFLAHGRAVFSDPGIVPLPKHRLVNKQTKQKEKKQLRKIERKQ